MAKRSIDSCLACGKHWHLARIHGTGDRAQYVCPLWKRWGKTGARLESGRCSECGASGFTYSNGLEVSADGVRGYRCLECGTIKPERS